MADKSHNQTDKLLEQMEKRISAIYSEAQVEMKKKAEAYFDAFIAEGDRKLKLVKAGKLSEAEYQKWVKNKIAYGKRFDQFKQQYAEAMSHVNEIAAAYINDQLPDIYALNYNGAGEDIASQVGGYSFTMADANTVKNLATRDTTLLPYKYINGKKDVRWNTQKVNAAITQGILQGESIPNIAKRLSKNIPEMNKASAIRNARTATTGAECAGRQSQYEDATRRGIQLQREWIAAIDMRTRHAHRLLDGQLADVDKPFESELGDIMFPGDPEAHPANVYNCRCTVAAKVIGIGKTQVNERLEKADRETAQDWWEKERANKYKDIASIDKRLAALERKMETSTDFGSWIEIEQEQAALVAAKQKLMERESQQRVDQIWRRIYEKDYFATKGIGKGTAVDLGGLDEESMRDVEKALDSIFSKFPSLKNKFAGISASSELQEGAMAACNAHVGEVKLSKSYFSSNSKLARAWDQSVANGFHPVGTSKHAAVVHEFGHAVDHYLTRNGDMFDPRYIGKTASASTKIKSQVMKELGIKDEDIASGLSKYATMNDREFVSEAFAEYITSPAPRSIAMAVGEKIKKMIGDLS